MSERIGARGADGARPGGPDRRRRTGREAAA